MRIRQIKPEWWRDKALMTRTHAETREFYIGLWMTADDAGWFEWDATAIGAEIYPFFPVNRRERALEGHAIVLESLEPASPHLVRYGCGHAEVPKMPQHQRVSREKRVTTHFDRHQRHCKSVSPPSPAGSREPPRVPVPVRNGKELVGNGINARAPEEGTSEFQRRVPRPMAAVR
jgi:hypothetical protein